MSVRSVEREFIASKSSGAVDALLVRPATARWMLVLGHGAGAGMRHPFLEQVSHVLAGHDIATFRYQFPYMQRGSRRPDPAPILKATVRSAIAAAAEEGLPLLAGGKSMGGRMTSLALSETDIPRVRGLVFLGFPLHPAGRPAAERGDHLAGFARPMLFLQGDRDKLAELSLLLPVCAALGERATLRVAQGADHSFHVLKRSGRTEAEVLAELGQSAADWIEDRFPASS